mgnify:CR=1 FL=1
MKNKIIIAIVVALLAGLAIGFRTEIANLPMTILVEDDQPQGQADYILIMMGNVTDRTPHAAQLLKSGLGKRIIFAEAEQTKMIRLGYRKKDGVATNTYLSEMGVPQDKIVFLSDSANTSSVEEVTLILDHIKKHDPDAKRVIIVTSWYHSSRATWIIRRRNQTDLQIESSPSPHPDKWWVQEFHFLNVFNEYLKWVYYLLKY